MIAIYSIFFTIWLTYNYKKYGVNISTIFLALYTLAAYSSIPLLYCFDHYDASRVSLESIIYFIVCFILFTSPLIHVGNKQTTHDYVFNDAMMNNIAIITACVIIPTMAYSFVQVIQLLQSYAFSLGWGVCYHYSHVFWYATRGCCRNRRNGWFYYISSAIK